MTNKQLKSILFLPLPLGEGSRGVRPFFFLLLLLFFSCTEMDSLLERDASTVSFSLPSGGLTPEPAVTRADDGVNMVVGTTVRVVAYRRPSGASSPVLSAANYAGEATYKVSLGSALELCAVQLDANGIPSVDAAATPVPLKLIQGTYDFYAVTPALEVNHTGANPTLNVRHRTDYAVSVTPAKAISPDNSTVGLTTLDRRCTLLSFSTDRKEDATDVTKVTMGDVQLTAMTNEPVVATGTNLLEVSSQPMATAWTIAASKFTVTDAVNAGWKAYGQEICLPKANGACNLLANVSFNGESSVLLTVEGLSMTFDPGKHYAFTIRFNSRGGAELLLGVEEWTDAVGSYQIGGTKVPVQVVVGEWADATGNTSVGGTHIPPFTPNVEAWGDLNGVINIGKKNQ